MSIHKGLLAGMLIAASAAAVGLAPSPARACDQSPYLGDVCWMGGSFCPQNYLPAAGQLVSISDYTALYALIATTYGGDGRTTFGLPDLRGRAIAGTGRPNPVTNGSPSSYALGQTVGTEKTFITEATMPAHTHAATFTGTAVQPTVQPKIQAVAATPTPATSMAPSAATPYLAGIVPVGLGSRKMWAASPGASTANVGGAAVTVSANPGASGGITVTNGQTGGSSSGTIAVPTLSPEVVMTACVAVNGTYPPRP